MYNALLDGILFLVGSDGISKEELTVLLDIDKERLEEVLEEYSKEFDNPSRGLTLVTYGNYVKLVTKDEYSEYLVPLVNTHSSMLSESAFEVLAIIAYNEPITRFKVDEIRGTNSTHIIRRLLDEGLVIKCGKLDLPGKPNLYRTTDLFLDKFKLESLDSLPEFNFDINSNNEEVIDIFESKYKENNNL